MSSAIVSPRRHLGLSLVEVSVVLTIIALLATVAYPVAQVFRQREKEKRLREILRQVREEGIQAYRRHVVRKLMLARDGGTLTNASLAWALATGSNLGHLFPPRVASLYAPVGPLEISVGPAATFTASVTTRFVRGWPGGSPPHPFTGWYSAASFTYLIQSPTGSRGIKDLRSRGAGYALDGSNTDGW